MNGPVDRVPGIVLLGLLSWHALEKVHLGVVSEMLWACHVATAVAMVGAFADRPGWVVIGGVFHLVVGLPGYVLDVLLHQVTTVSSAMLHVATPAAGLFAARRAGVPVGTGLIGAGMFIICAALAREFTAPALNINLAFEAYDVWPAGTPAWFAWGANTAFITALLVGAEWLLVRAFGRPR